MKTLIKVALLVLVLCSPAWATDVQISQPVRTKTGESVTVAGTITANQGTANATPWNENIAQIAGTATVTGGAAGLLAVAGPVASGTANANNPIKIGGVFNTTQPTVTTGQIVDLQATARGALIVAAGTEGFTVSANQPTSAQIQTCATADLAPAGTANCDTTTLTSGQTAKLVHVSCSASVPLKCDIQTLLNASGTSRVVQFTSAVDLATQYIPPHMNYITQAFNAGAGADALRVTVTNNEPSGGSTAGAYITILWDLT